TCSTASCHASPYGSSFVTTPVWSTASGCDACHSANPIAATGPDTGSHAKHNDSTCTDCHNAGTTATSKPTTSHADGNIDVTNGYPVTAKHAVGSYTGTCSTASCHASPYGSSFVTTPVWSTASGCDACHSANPIAATGPNTGSHVLHANSAGTVCTNCHNAGTTATSKPTTSHADGSINVTNGYPVTAKHAAGTYVGTCSTASCHGSNSPVWGANTSNDTCTKCHGTPTVTVTAENKNVIAPPKSVAGNTGTLTGTGQVSNDAKVGAHQTHLLYSNGVRTTLAETIEQRCVFCHGTLPTVGTHADAVSTPTWSGLATKNGAMSPSYVAAGATCNNTYCHNPAGTGGVLNASSAGTGTAPVWTNAVYIADGTLKTAANCGVCHKVPESPVNPLWSYSTTHSTYTVDSDCSGCHGHNGSGGTHMDGTRQASGACNSCHGYGPTATDGKPERAIEGKGAHEKHVNHLLARWGGTLNPTTDAFGSGASWTNVCGVCHNGASHNMSEAIGGTGRTISIPAAYQFGASAPVYNGTVGVSSATTPKTCSNVSCHFQTTPVWSAY
ncbi:MAG: CxxxxCH/CxxCH domain c-type cytochrome, partial [Nitrospirota bacterium]